jgi:hypothetical protein
MKKNCCTKAEFISNVILFFLSGIVFMIACLIYFTDTSIYGKVLFNETNEWAENAIVDVTQNNLTHCP